MLELQGLLKVLVERLLNIVKRLKNSKKQIIQNISIRTN